MHRIPLSEAAIRLGLTYHQVRQRVFRGELPGGRDEFGRFYVDGEAVEAAVPAKSRRAEAPSA